MNKPLKDYLSSIETDMRNSQDIKERNDLYQNAVGAVSLFNVSEGLNTKTRNIVEEIEYKNGFEALKELKSLI